MSFKIHTLFISEFQIGDEVFWSNNRKFTHAVHRECMTGWLMASEKCTCCRNYYLGSGNNNDTVHIVSSPEIRNYRSWDERSTITLCTHDVFESNDTLSLVDKKQDELSMQSFATHEFIDEMLSNVDNFSLVSGVTAIKHEFINENEVAPRSLLSINRTGDLLKYHY